MTAQEKYNLTMLTITLTALALGIVMTYRRYRNYKAALLAHRDAVIVSPPMLKFLLYGFAYVLFLSIPGLLFFWVIEPEHEMFWGYLIVMPWLWLAITIPAYPYLALSIHNGSIEGARSWNFLEQRVEISLSKVDREKTLRQNFLHQIGIVVFHSVSGDKILTIGLDNVQLSRVLEMDFNGGD